MQIKHQIKLSIIIIMFLLAFAGCSKKSEVKITEEGDIIKRTFIEKGKTYEYVFQKSTKTPVSNIYMIYGLQPNHQNFTGDAYIAAIPIAQAKSLLSKYPNLDQCDGEGSNVAKHAIKDFIIIYPEYSLAKTSLEEAENKEKSSHYRICLKLTGTMLNKVKGTVNGQPLEFLNNVSYIYLSDTHVVSCNN